MQRKFGKRQAFGKICRLQLMMHQVLLRFFFSNIAGAASAETKGFRDDVLVLWRRCNENAWENHKKPVAVAV